MPTARRKTAHKTPSFGGATAPRTLPDETDPTRQPMPGRDPLDPPPVTPDPAPPPNGEPGQDSGPLTPTPASHAIPPRLPPEAPDEDPDEDENGVPPEKNPPEYEDMPPHDEPANPDDEDVDENASPPLATGADVVFEPANYPPLTGTIRYESRIQILDAFQYPGSLVSAPAWVDRNWIGWANDQDDLRGIEPGPCLRVPLISGLVGICRIGDYVARQETRLVVDQPGEIRVEVWPQEQFAKMFLPVSAKDGSGKAFHPFDPAHPPVIEHETKSSRRSKPSRPAASAPEA